MTTSPVSSLRITGVKVLDQDEALDFYCGTLGFEVRDDIDMGFMRWLTIGVPGQEAQLLLELPGGPMHDQATADALRDLLTKGALGGIFLTTDDVQAAYEKVRAAGAEITQEPVEQPYGVDFGLRDPFGNHVRISQLAQTTGDFSAEVKARYEREASA